jgi:hypothetical protein
MRFTPQIAACFPVPMAVGKMHQVRRDSQKFVMYCLSPRRVRERAISVVLTPVLAR